MVYKKSSVKIVRENLGLIHIDGETVDTTQEVSFSIVPESLQVIVPI